MAWVIRGFDGLDQIFEHPVPDGEGSEIELAAILQRLAAKNLSYEEIVAASLPHGRSVGLLDLTLDDTVHGRRLSTVGTPYFVAESDGAENDATDPAHELGA